MFSFHEETIDVGTTRDDENIVQIHPKDHTRKRHRPQPINVFCLKFDSPLSARSEEAVRRSRWVRVRVTYCQIMNAALVNTC